jgi:selenocysteine lyase/cysteine desulfurase
VVFTYNCTDSINMVLRGWLKPGSHVITTSLDHNAVARPLEYLRKSLPIEVSRVPFRAHGEIVPEDLKFNIRNNTTLIVLTHGSNLLGSVVRLPEIVSIAKEAGIPVLLDAAQTAGRIPIDLGDAPVFLACSAHKSLFGFPGLGILIVPPGLNLEYWRLGGSGSSSESAEHPVELPMRLEAGTPNVPAIASVDAGITFISEVGIGEIHEKEIHFVQQLQNFLNHDSRFRSYSNFDQQERLAIASFNLDGVPSEELAVILDQSFGIAVRGGLHCAGVVHGQLGTLGEGCIRVSPGFFNTEEDMSHLMDALKQIAEKY